MAFIVLGKESASLYTYDIWETYDSQRLEWFSYLHMAKGMYSHTYMITSDSRQAYPECYGATIAKVSIKSNNMNNNMVIEYE